MATRRTTNSTKAAKCLVCCKDCFWANLIQYDNNPVLAECRQKPNYYNEKFPYERDVASSLKYCDMHKHDDAEKFIQKRVSVRRHVFAAHVKSNTGEGKVA